MPEPEADLSSRFEPAHRDAGRDRGVRRVLWLVLGVNLSVAAIKLGLGKMTGAIALVADGLHSLLDASSNIVGLVGIAIASRGPDAGHPYGHRRFETLAAVVIGLLIAAGLVEILRTLIGALLGTHDPPQVGWISALALAATVVVNLAISHYERRRGRQLQSSLLDADAGHTLSDALAASVVLASFGGSALGLWWADLVAAAIVCVFIGHTAWEVLSQNLGVLTERAQIDPLEIHRVATGVPGVHGAHHIRSRGAPDRVEVDLHVHLEPELNVVDAHAKTHEVADTIRAAFPRVTEVLIHTEPADGREQDTARIAPPENPAD